MKMNTITRSALAGIIFSILMSTTGCQTPGQVVSTTKSEACPTCENQIVTTPIKGLKYTKHVCPSCKTTKTIDPNGVYDEIGPDILTVHVCKKCSSIVEPCKQCNTK